MRSEPKQWPSHAFRLEPQHKEVPVNKKLTNKWLLVAVVFLAGLGTVASAQSLFRASVIVSPALTTANPESIAPAS